MSSKYTLTISDKWDKSLKEIAETKSLQMDKKIDPQDLMRNALEATFNLNCPNLEIFSNGEPRKVRLKMITGLSFESNYNNQTLVHLLIDKIFSNQRGYVFEKDYWFVENNITLKKETYEFLFDEIKPPTELKTYKRFRSRSDRFRAIKTSNEIFTILCPGKNAHPDWWLEEFTTISLAANEFNNIFEVNND
jgi:hypothetical protein